MAVTSRQVRQGARPSQWAEECCDSRGPGGQRQGGQGSQGQPGSCPKESDGVQTKERGENLMEVSWHGGHGPQADALEGRGESERAQGMQGHGSRPGRLRPPGDRGSALFGCHSWGLGDGCATDIWWAEARDAVKCPAARRTASTLSNHLAPVVEGANWCGETLTSRFKWLWPWGCLDRKATW